MLGCQTATNTTGLVVKDEPQKENRTGEVPISKAKVNKTMPPKKEENKTTVENIKNSTLKQEEKHYDLEQLEKEVNEIMGSSYQFEEDDSYPDYVRSSALKYYVFHIIKDKNEFIESPKEFCKTYCATNWKGWEYYINMSNYRAYQPLATRNNFTNEENYKDYLRDASYLKHMVVEKSYRLKNGVVLEYQLILWHMGNSQTYFEGAGSFGTSLIYKIPCAPNITIFIRPKWDIYTIQFPAATMEDTYKTWNDYIVPVRQELLQKADELLERCPISSDFFENYEFPEYSDSKMLVGYWKIYYNYFFNLTRNVSIGVKQKNDGAFVLKQVNISFTNYDDVEAYNAYGKEGIGLRIVVIPDEKGDISYYDHRVTGMLEPSQKIERSLSHREVEFSNNITIEASLYAEEKVDIRPLRKTFTKNDLIKSG